MHNITSTGIIDVFVLKLYLSVNFLGVKNYRGTSMSIAESIILDVSGNVLITGRFAGIVDFDDGTGTSIL